MEEGGRDYVVGVPARKHKGVRDVVLSTKGRYHPIKGVKEAKLEGNRYIICHNPKEAERAQATRTSIVEELQEEIDGLNPVTKKAHRLLTHFTKSKYLRELKDGTLRIESSFHSLKSLEEVTPIYHRTPKRMRGHIFVCVLAHLLERALQKRLRKEELDLTAPQAIRELGRMKAVKMEVDGDPYLFRTEGSQEVHQVLKALHMRPPARVKEL